MEPVWLQSLRDISIIILAVESIVIGIILAVLLIQVRKLVQLIQEELIPLMNSVNDTMGTVRGTANFVSDRVVSPTIKVWSYGAAARQVMKVVLGRKATAEEP